MAFTDMKKYLKYILFAAISFGFAACVEEEWTPGERDLIDCHGLFFPQEQAQDYVLTPADASKALVFTVERTVTDDEADVPYEIVCSEEGFFTINDEVIHFEEGQKKTTFKVYMDGDFELGTKYSCSIKVTDPLYVSSYSLSSNELAFSVSFVEWTRLKGADGSEYGYYRDDFFTSYAQQLGAELAQPNLEKPVAVYERSDLPGYYRVDEIYTSSYISQMYAGDESYTETLAQYCPVQSIYINATNPEKVYIDAQFAFYDPFMNYGAAYICSDVQEVFDAGYSNSYGVLRNGVIEFPIKQSLVIYLPSAGTAYANLSAKTRLVLPGYKGYDYSIALSFSESVAGVMPIEFTLGPDVAKAKYQVFEGHLNDVELVSKLEEVKSGKNVKEVTTSGVYDFTADKSALYTLIACTYDASGKYQNYDYIKFGYDTAADPMDVDIHLGLIVSDKNAPLGLTAENSMEFYLYGSEIIEARAAIFKKAQYEDFKEAIQSNVRYAPSYALDKYQLEDVNNAGYSGLVGNLTPGVEYTLIVYADNGYHSGYFTADATTEGVFNILDAEYDIYDLPDRLQPETHDVYLNKEWQVLSLDPYKATKWGRENRGNVKFSDKTDVMYDKDGNITRDPAQAVTTMDYISLEGLHPNLAAKGLKDAIDFEFYEGFVYSLMTQMQPFTYEGALVYPTNCYLYFVPDGSLSPYLENGALIGGFLTEEQDVIAFVSNPVTAVGTSGFTYVGMQLCYFGDESYSSDGYLFEEDAHAYPMLVSSDSKYVSAAPAEVSALAVPQACNAISLELSKSRRNYVENPSGYVKSTIDIVRKGMPYNYMQNVTSVNGVRDVEVAEYSMKNSSSTLKKNPSGEIEFFERILR